MLSWSYFSFHFEAKGPDSAAGSSEADANAFVLWCFAVFALRWWQHPQQNHPHLWWLPLLILEGWAIFRTFWLGTGTIWKEQTNQVTTLFEVPADLGNPGMSEESSAPAPVNVLNLSEEPGATGPKRCRKGAPGAMPFWCLEAPMWGSNTRWSDPCCFWFDHFAVQTRLPVTNLPLVFVVALHKALWV